MVKARYAAAFLASMAFALCNAHAQSPITVGVRGGHPFARVEPSGQVTGLYGDLVAAIAAHSGTPMRATILPFPRLRKYLKTGAVTAILGVPDRQMLDNSTVVGNVIDFEVIALGRTGTRLQSMDDLRGKRLCLSRGSSLVPELYEEKGYLLTEVTHHDSCAKMLVAGRVDAIISIRIGLIHILARMGKTMADFGEPYLIKRVPVQLLVSRVHAQAALIEALRIGLQKAKASGQLAAVQSKYEIVSTRRGRAIPGTYSSGPSK